MKYKGYFGSAELDEESGAFHGALAAIRDVVTFRGQTRKELKRSFRESVDDYLEFCNNCGEVPDSPVGNPSGLKARLHILRQLPAD